jgi:anti-sigma factor RsiW
MKTPERVSDAELHALVDGQLTDARAREIVAWLGAHPQEAQRVGGWRAQNEAIRRAFPAPARERATTPLRPEAAPPLAASDVGASRLIDYRARARRRRALAISLAFATGAALAAGVAFAIQKMNAATARQPEPVRVEIVRAGPDSGAAAAAAWRAYAQDRTRAVEIGARDRAALANWIGDRAGLTPLPEAAGLRLVGGRVLPGHAANAAFLLYETAEGDRLALVAEASALEPVATTPPGADTLNAVAWRSGDLVFGLAGQVSRAKLEGYAAGFAERRRP